MKAREFPLKGIDEARDFGGACVVRHGYGRTRLWVPMRGGESPWKIALTGTVAGKLCFRTRDGADAFLRGETKEDYWLPFAIVWARDPFEAAERHRGTVKV